MSIVPQGFQAHKYHALGNGYLVVDPAELNISLSSNVIAALCDRNRGVGSDGILYGHLSSFSSMMNESENGAASIERNAAQNVSAFQLTGARTNGVFALRIFNPDGSEAEKSGNGLRIFSLYLFERGLVGERPFQVQTKGGLVECRVLRSAGKSGTSVVSADYSRHTDTNNAYNIDEELNIEVAMGEPQFLPGSSTLTFDGIEFHAERVSMGNPHCVLVGLHPTEDQDIHLRAVPLHAQQLPGQASWPYRRCGYPKNARWKTCHRYAKSKYHNDGASCAHLRPCSIA